MYGTMTETITIYNRRYDGDQDVYHRTVVRGVSWYSRQDVNGEGAGRDYAKLFQIRIPDSAKAEKTFITPALWTDPDTQYTLQDGDRIVLGETAYEVQPGESWEALSSLFPEVCTIMGYHDNRRRLLPHIFVEGK